MLSKEIQDNLKQQLILKRGTLHKGITQRKPQGQIQEEQESVPAPEVEGQSALQANPKMMSPALAQYAIAGTPHPSESYFDVAEEGPNEYSVGATI